MANSAYSVGLEAAKEAQRQFERQQREAKEDSFKMQEFTQLIISNELLKDQVKELRKSNELLTKQLENSQKNEMNLRKWQIITFVISTGIAIASLFVAISK